MATRAARGFPLVRESAIPSRSGPAAPVLGSLSVIWRYTVTGTVREAETGRALPGLVVRGFDKDLIFDDPLGEVRTDAEGGFELEFTDEAFRSPVDENPDLYLLVFDAAGTRQLLSTKERIRRAAGAEEHYDLEIPKADLEAE